jgi:triphosphatase
LGGEGRPWYPDTVGHHLPAGTVEGREPSLEGHISPERRSFVAEQSSTEETVSTQDSGAKRSSESRRQSRGVQFDGGGRGAKAGQKALAGTDSQEVEWHFDVDDLGPVEGWLGEVLPASGLVVSPGSADALVDGYYDTEDWRLYRAGYALRIRQTGGEVEATMKSLAPSEGGLRRRREISEPLKDAKIDALRTTRGPVAERLRLLVGEREVKQIFEVRNNRKTFALNLSDEEGGATEGAADSAAAGKIVQDASGDVRESSSGREAGKDTRIGEVVLDSAQIPLGGGERDLAGLTRVEVEVVAGVAFDPRVQGFVRQMKGSLGLRQARISKYEAGLFAMGLSPEGWADLGPTGVNASLSLGEMAFAVLRRQFAAIRVHESGTRLGEDPEELHDMRVATRRMRAAIKIFQEALPERSRWLREEMRHFAGVLGEVRDLDVQIEEVSGLSSGDGEEDEALAAVVASLERRRAEARVRMLEALDSERYARFESSFAAMLRRGHYVAETPEASPANGSSGASAAGVPALEAAPGILGRLYSKWRKAARSLERNSQAEEFHDLRKKGKRLRYACEFFSGVYGEKATGALVGPLKAVQDSLGRHQDAMVAAELLREIAIETPRLPKRTVFAMGLLSQRFLAEAAELRVSSIAAKEYRALVGGKAWKAFEKLMEKERRAVGKPRKDAGKGKKERK